MKNKLTAKMINHWNRVQREVVKLFPVSWCLQIKTVFYPVKYALIKEILRLDTGEVRLDKVIIPLTLKLYKYVPSERKARLWLQSGTGTPEISVQGLALLQVSRITTSKLCSLSVPLFTICKVWRIILLLFSLLVIWGMESNLLGVGTDLP